MKVLLLKIKDKTPESNDLSLNNSVSSAEQCIEKTSPELNQPLPIKEGTQNNSPSTEPITPLQIKKGAQNNSQSIELKFTNYRRHTK